MFRNHYSLWHFFCLRLELGGVSHEEHCGVRLLECGMGRTKALRDPPRKTPLLWQGKGLRHVDFSRTLGSATRNTTDVPPDRGSFPG